MSDTTIFAFGIGVFIMTGIWIAITVYSLSSGMGED